MSRFILLIGNVMFADHKKTLTIFHDILKATPGELDDQSVDTIAKQLLLHFYNIYQQERFYQNGS